MKLDVRKVGIGDPIATKTKLLHTITNDAYPTYKEYTLDRRQGGCMYGDCIFQVFLDSTDSYAVLVRKNVKTGETVYSKVVDVLEHANDMTYNPKTKTVYVALAYKTYSKKVYAFTEDCFAPAGQTPKANCKAVDITSYASGLDYVEEKDIYVVYSGGAMYFYNSGWKEIIPEGKESSAVKIAVMGNITQGICADGEHIYMIFCTVREKGKYDSYVYIYDHDMNYINRLDVEIVGDYEPEHISVIDGTLCIGACSQPFGFYEIEAK